MEYVILSSSCMLKEVSPPYISMYYKKEKI